METNTAKSLEPENTNLTYHNQRQVVLQSRTSSGPWTWSSHTLLVIHPLNQNTLWDQPWSPSRSVTHSLPFSLLFSLQQHNNSAVLEPHNTELFPRCTCDDGLEKYRHSQRKKHWSSECWCFVVREVSALRGRSGLGTFPGLLNRIGLFWLTM